jgi:NAD(P)-dependent dehydrogenase (short-subunit alcohol dehydrogenase family)
MTTKNQTWLITGGGRGIGQATALRCLRDGGSVLICDNSSERGQQTLKLAADAGAGDRIRFLEGDVTDEKTIIQMVDECISAFGDLDCLVNNAGHGMSTDTVTELSAADWDAASALLIRAPFLGTKYGARAMQNLGHGGSIVNISSIAGLSAGAGPLGYTTFKAALINFTRGAAVDLASSGIRVNSICPGMILTPLNMYIGDDAEALEESRAFFTTLQPLPVAGKAEFIAAGVAFLSSDDASWITGHNLVIDGGNSIHNLISNRVYEWIENRP